MLRAGHVHILCLQCADRPGIVAAVAAALSEAGCNIEEASQFNDHLSGQFFMRVVYAPLTDAAQADFCLRFEQVGAQFGMRWAVYDGALPVKTLVLVSREGHCLNNLLYRWGSGDLPIDVRGVVSNHETSRGLAERYDLPFHYLPVSAGEKAAQEDALASIIEDSGAELIVLARYMQILSSDFCQRYAGRVINIHHSFLPGFKGAKPYTQAFERGVKLIGATAHFATEDLDEGPIIEQETVRITHADTPERLRRTGQDTEEKVLARAIRLYAERRVFLQGHRTVIL